MSPDMNEHFVQLIAEHQNRLYGYVYSLLGEHSRAADVLQETNMLLWRKSDEFDAAQPFLPWAFAIARYQVLAHLRDRKRDRLLLDAELAATISDEAQQQTGHVDEFHEALRQCLKTLTSANRDLIEHRYLRSATIADLARSLGRSTGAIKVALMRARRQLADCIQGRLAAETE